MPRVFCNMDLVKIFGSDNLLYANDFDLCLQRGEFFKILSMSSYCHPSNKSPRGSGYFFNIVFPNTTSWLATIHYLTIGSSISYDKGVAPTPKNEHRFGHQSSF